MTAADDLERQDKFFQENGPFSDPTGGYIPGDDDEEYRDTAEGDDDLEPIEEENVMPAPQITHLTELIGVGEHFWECSCGEVYPVNWPDGKRGVHSPIAKVEVNLFKDGGKYYTTEHWRIPSGAIGPYDMDKSPDFKRISGTGPVLVISQEPWGYPHLFPGLPRNEA